MIDADVIIVGGGIVGLATARMIMLRRPGTRVVVLEKESGPARHQTGRNSGVIHSGLYYEPGSLKATLCRRGKKMLEDCARDLGVPHEPCGKLVVATDDEERPALHRLHERAIANGVDCRLIGSDAAREIEPHVRVVEAIHVPETGIIDYLAMAQALASQLADLGGELRCGVQVVGVAGDDGTVVVKTTSGRLEASRVINCGGLQSDRLARAGGVDPEVRIIPFRGDYHELRPEAAHLCRGLIYPVPNPDFPFLGVHLTRMIGGGVECGPNAVLSLAREGYGRASFDFQDAIEALGWPGFRRLAVRHWREGWAELRRSWSRRLFTRSLQRLVPAIREEDLLPAPAGNRAQAVHRDGSLIDDFVIERRGSVVHVVNAPSPAATASLAIGERICDVVFEN